MKKIVYFSILSTTDKDIFLSSWYKQEKIVEKIIISSNDNNSFLSASYPKVDSLKFYFIAWIGFFRACLIHCSTALV